MPEVHPEAGEGAEVTWWKTWAPPQDDVPPQKFFPPPQTQAVEEQDPERPLIVDHKGRPLVRPKHPIGFHDD